MIDFTSSLYLGMLHESTELQPWPQLTTGSPAALLEPNLSRQLAYHIAGMQGLQSGMLAPSTLHLYWDLYGFLGKRNPVLFIDEYAYPASRYGIERLLMKKIPVYRFRHHNAHHLVELLRTKLPKRSFPVVITDGWCTECGRTAPAGDYAQLVASSEGLVIVDDTQAFGILGERGVRAYGTGGGGTLKWASVSSPSIVTIVSLAKAFGVPVAAISGTQQFMSAYIQHSDTRVYSSPVSNAHLQAVVNALAINRHTGDRRRALLYRNVLLLREKLHEAGIQPAGACFPVQRIKNHNSLAGSKLTDALLAHGIATALVSSHDSSPAICFLVRSNHIPEDFQCLRSVLKTLVPSPATM